MSVSRDHWYENMKVFVQGLAGLLYKKRLAWTSDILQTISLGAPDDGLYKAIKNNGLTSHAWSSISFPLGFRLENMLLLLQINLLQECQWVSYCNESCAIAVKHMASF